VGTWNSWPNFNAWLENTWGSGAEFWVSCGFYGAANLTFGTNPPYTLDDFLAVYPKFFGQPTAYPNATLTSGSATINIANTAGLLIGQFMQAQGLQPGTVIIGVGNGQITVNKPATTSGNTTLLVCAAPLLPVGVIQLYLNLASASLQQVRWQEQWYIAMAWFIAHYCQLYLESDAVEIINTTQASLHGEVPQGIVPGTVYTLSDTPPTGVLQGLYKNGSFIAPSAYTLVGSTLTLTTPTVLNDQLYATWPIQTNVVTTVPMTPQQAAAQGVANGIMVSKSVGDVSASYQALSSLEAWGAWNLTKYGQQLVTMAKVVGSGPMVIW
jgi:hypothetical protein